MLYKNEKNICPYNATKMRRCEDVMMQDQGNVHPALQYCLFITSFSIPCSSLRGWVNKHFQIQIRVCVCVSSKSSSYPWIITIVIRIQIEILTHSSAHLITRPLSRGSLSWLDGLSLWSWSSSSSSSNMKGGVQGGWLWRSLCYCKSCQVWKGEIHDDD